MSRGVALSHGCVRFLSMKVGPPMLPQLTLYTGTDCQLCDVAKGVLEEASKVESFELSLYNIRDDSLPEVHHWRRAYQYDIPVLHLNGKEIARHRLDLQRLVETIRQASRDEADSSGARS